MTRTSKLWLEIGLMGVLLAPSAPASVARAPGAVGAGEPDSFQIISQRNIFDPARLASLPPSNQPPPTVEFIGLKGTMTYGDQAHAFFEGVSLSRPVQTLRPLDAIAGCRILAIASDFVRIVTPAGRQIELAVGGQMQRTGDGDWEISPSESIAQKPDSGRNDTAKQTPVWRRTRQ